MRAASAWMIVAMAIGCGPGRRSPAAATPSVPSAPSEPAAVDAGAPAPVEIVAPPAPAITADECGQLVDKLLAIGLAEQHARAPKAPQATAEQQAAIRAALLDQLLPSCATLPRASWTCAMTAGDRAAMSACEADAP